MYSMMSLMIRYRTLENLLSIMVERNLLTDRWMIHLVRITLMSINLFIGVLVLHGMEFSEEIEMRYSPCSSSEIL